MNKEKLQSLGLSDRRQTDRTDARGQIYRKTQPIIEATMQAIIFLPWPLKFIFGQE